MFFWFKKCDSMIEDLSLSLSLLNVSSKDEWFQRKKKRLEEKKNARGVELSDSESVE